MVESGVKHTNPICKFKFVQRLQYLRIQVFQAQNLIWNVAENNRNEIHCKLRNVKNQARLFFKL